MTSQIIIRHYHIITHSDHHQSKEILNIHMVIEINRIMTVQIVTKERTMAFVKLYASGALFNSIKMRVFKRFNSRTLDPAILITISISDKAVRKSFFETFACTPSIFLKNKIKSFIRFIKRESN